MEACKFLMQSLSRAGRIHEWNQEVAAKLREVADLLAVQGANPFRVNAFRRAAATVAELPRDIREIAEAEGQAGLMDIPNVGRGIAAAIIEMVATGRCSRLDRLRGELALITPRRFNPEGEAWLPVLHTQRGGWHFSALYSNTARAHELGHTRDWVVVYYYDHDHHEHQCTVVTEFRGPLRGKRVVRGREGECGDFYGKSALAVR